MLGDFSKAAADLESLSDDATDEAHLAELEAEAKYAEAVQAKGHATRAATVAARLRELIA